MKSLIRNNDFWKIILPTILKKKAEKIGKKKGWKVKSN